MGKERAADIRLAHAHIRHGLPFSAETQRFVCLTCQRSLPESQFALAGEGKPRARLGRVFYLYPDCRTCFQRIHTEVAKHPMWTPELHAAAVAGVGRARNGAKQRGLLVLITEQDVLKLFYAQSGRCALSGLPMTFDRATIATPRANRRSMSIDRIHADRNYTRDNIQLVCWTINAMKSDMPEDEFRFWCAQVVLNGDEEC